MSETGAVGTTAFRVVPQDERAVALFRPGLFVLADSDVVFKVWTDGRRWNGWEMPRFERMEAERVLAWLSDKRAGLTRSGMRLSP